MFCIFNLIKIKKFSKGKYFNNLKIYHVCCPSKQKVAFVCV